MTINLNPNDRDDILQLLDYALEYKLQEPHKNNWNESGYWKIRIPQLKKLIKGSKVNETIYQSSFCTIEAGGINDSHSKKRDM